MRDEVVVSPENRAAVRGTAARRRRVRPVYLSKKLGRSPLAPDVLCLKSARASTAGSAAHFGQLLHEHPRAIQIFDRFPVMRARGTVL